MPSIRALALVETQMCPDGDLRFEEINGRPQVVQPAVDSQHGQRACRACAREAFRRRTLSTECPSLPDQTCIRMQAKGYTEAHPKTGPLKQAHFGSPF